MASIVVAGHPACEAWGCLLLGRWPVRALVVPSTRTAEAPARATSFLRSRVLLAVGTSATVAGADARRRRHAAQSRSCTAMPDQVTTEEQQHEDLYMRVMCTAVQFVGQRGAVLGVEQISKADGDYHFPELPVAVPVLLGEKEAEDFRSSRRDLEWTESALCEVRIHLPETGCLHAEALLTEGCVLPPSNDGFLFVEAVAEGERVVEVPVGEALAMALKLKAPVLLSTRFLLRAAQGAMEKLRDEQVCDGDEGCDVQLENLIEDLEGAREPSRERLGEILESVKPFAWYWSEHRQGGELEKASLAEFITRYQQECANTYRAAW